MKRKYRLILIILISAIFTYFIYFYNINDKINLVAIGDGIASGETSYDIDGISYNDYLKEYFERRKILKSYNNKYTYENYELSDFINDLNTNNLKEKVDLYIKQLLHQADLITISFGEEKLSKLAITKDLDMNYLKNFIQEYDNLLYLLREITEAKIIIIGFYENAYLDKSSVIVLNSEISNIAINYGATFINISDLMLNKDYYLDSKSIYFNYKGHKRIAEMIIHSF